MGGRRSQGRRASHRAFVFACAAVLGAATAACSSHDSSGPGAGPADSGGGTTDGGGLAYGCGGTVDSSGRPPICDFAHFAFRVSDLQKARQFYGDYLGFAEPFQVPGGMVAVFKINDNQFIELHQESAAAGDTNYQLKDIAFYTSDAEALRKFFASKNVQVPASVSKNILGNTSFTVADPDGHVVEWIQYEADSMTGQTQGQAMPSTRVGGSVHHLGVSIMDPNASNAFYEMALGFLPSSTADKQAAEDPNATVRIEYGVSPGHAPSKAFALIRDHLCLRVPDTMQAIRTLISRNPAVPLEHHVLDGFTVRANVLDPDGSRIEMADSVLLSNGEDSGAADYGNLDSGNTDGYVTSGAVDSGTTD